MTVRRGKWTRVPGVGWQYDGTPLVLDYDPLDGSGDLRGCWVLSGHCSDPWWQEPIDHYLDGAMAYIEQNLETYAPLTLL